MSERSPQKILNASKKRTAIAKNTIGWISWRNSATETVSSCKEKTQHRHPKKKRHRQPQRKARRRRSSENENKKQPAIPPHAPQSITNTSDITTNNNITNIITNNNTKTTRYYMVLQQHRQPHAYRILSLGAVLATRPPALLWGGAVQCSAEQNPTQRGSKPTSKRRQRSLTTEYPEAHSPYPPYCLYISLVCYVPHDNPRKSAPLRTSSNCFSSPYFSQYEQQHRPFSH